MVQAAEADVVGPAVAAEDPDALADQVVGRRPAGAFAVATVADRAASRCLSVGHRARCASISGSSSCGCRQRSLDQLVAQLRRRAALSSCGRSSHLLVDRPGGSRGRTRRCPRTASWTRPGRGPRALMRVGRGGQVAAVDRRAAGGVGDHHAVAEELRQQLDVGRLAAAGAGAGELEQRLQELRALDRVELDLACGRRRGS